MLLYSFPWLTCPVLWSGKLTNVQVEEWRNELTKQPTVRLLTDIVEAFRSAVAAIGAGKQRFRLDFCCDWNRERYFFYILEESFFTYLAILVDSSSMVRPGPLREPPLLRSSSTQLLINLTGYGMIYNLGLKSSPPCGALNACRDIIPQLPRAHCEKILAQL
jgi:hypothetical protein